MIAQPQRIETTNSGTVVAGTLWPSSGRTIVLIHGLTAEQESWRPLVGMLAEDHQVLTVDLRGHGASSWATWEPDGYTASRMADDVARVCADLGVVDAVVVGHSLGARVAMALAADERLVAGIVLSDTFPVVGLAGAKWANEQIGERLTLGGLRDPEEVTAWLQARHPEWNDEWAPLLAGTHFKQNWVGRWIFKCDPQLIWLLRGAASRAEGARVREMAAGVRQPTELLWGRDSPLVEEADVIESTAIFSNAVVREFPTGHYIMREQEAEWVEVVHDFSARLV